MQTSRHICNFLGKAISHLAFTRCKREKPLKKVANSHFDFFSVRTICYAVTLTLLSFSPSAIVLMCAVRQLRNEIFVYSFHQNTRFAFQIINRMQECALNSIRIVADRTTGIFCKTKFIIYRNKRKRIPNSKMSYYIIRIFEIFI